MSDLKLILILIWFWFWFSAKEIGLHPIQPPEEEETWWIGGLYLPHWQRRPDGERGFQNALRSTQGPQSQPGKTGRETGVDRTQRRGGRLQTMTHKLTRTRCDVPSVATNFEHQWLLIRQKLQFKSTCVLAIVYWETVAKSLLTVGLDEERELCVNKKLLSAFLIQPDSEAFTFDSSRSVVPISGSVCISSGSVGWG